MTTPEPPNPVTSERRSMTRAEWIAIGALSVSVLGGAFNLGVVYADVRDHERRINAQEVKVDALIPKVERIDANVSFLAEQAREERARR